MIEKSVRSHGATKVAWTDKQLLVRRRNSSKFGDQGLRYVRHRGSAQWKRAITVSNEKAFVARLERLARLCFARFVDSQCHAQISIKTSSGRKVRDVHGCQGERSGYN